MSQKDALLESMQKTLKDNAATVDELMQEAKQLAAMYVHSNLPLFPGHLHLLGPCCKGFTLVLLSRTEAEYKVQLEAKSRELAALQALLDEAKNSQTDASPGRSPRFSRAQEKKSDRVRLRSRPDSCLCLRSSHWLLTS